MTENILAKLFEHNNWANHQIIQVCVALSDVQLDAEPRSTSFGSIRATLTHLVSAQQGYLSLLSLPVHERVRITPAFNQLLELARSSGEGLLALTKGEESASLKKPLQTRDGYIVEPWVVMLQSINHATEHREQIKAMLSALGVTPPDLDGWSYGEATHALVPISG